MLRRALFPLLAATAAISCRSPAPRESPEQVFGRLSTVAFAGDTVLARRMNAFVGEHGPSAPLAGVRDVLAGADVAIVNLECIVASTGEMADKGERNPYYFRGRPELVRVLTEAGVDVASLGNNHAADYGPVGVTEGVRILRDAGVDPVGGGQDERHAMAPVFRQIGDTVVGFIGLDMTQRVTGARGSRGGAHFVDERDPDAVVARVREQVRLARRYAHVVLLATHWGPNGAEEPGRDHRSLARRLVREAGIDGLLGSSAHQLHGLEAIDGRPIIYDAGNILFDYNSDEWTHKTAIFILHLDREGVRWVEVVPVRMRSNRATLADGADADEILNRMDELSRRLGTVLRMEPDRALLGLWERHPPPPPRERFVPPAPRRAVLPSPDSYRPPVTVAAVPASATAMSVQFEGGIELLGYEMPATSRRREGVRITTYWRTSAPIGEAYQIFTHAEPGSGEPRWIGDHEPGDWMYPTPRWRPGEIVRDVHQIRPPAESATGPHTVYVGLFRESRRLATIDPGQADREQRVALGTLTVE